MKKERFDIYVPLHLRRLRLDIQQFIVKKEERNRGFIKKFKNIFDKH